MFPAAFITPALIGITLAISAGVSWLKFVHEPNIRAEYAAELTAKTNSIQAEFQQAAIQALQDADRDSQMRDSARVIVRERIIREPVIRACVESPSIGVALDGLRSGSNGPGSTGSTQGPPRVPAPASDPSGSK